MSLICFHASHEQFSPSRLLKLAVLAEQAGFDAIHCSDHFHPWSQRQGESGFSFSWLGAAMQATKLPFSMVCSPGQRYHPAVVAQAVATLGEMFPGRFDIELGSGEAINEMITGEPWPSKPERNERLAEAAQIIRKLLQGEEVSSRGRIQIEKARLYTLPTIIPLLYCAAISKETCAWAGTWADGVITTGGNLEDTGEKIDAFTKNGGANKPYFIQLSFSFANSIEDAGEGAYHQWRTNLIDADKLANLQTVSEFEKEGEQITREDVNNKVKLFAYIKDLMNWVDQFNTLQPARIILHNVHPNQEYFINEYRRHH